MDFVYCYIPFVWSCLSLAFAHLVYMGCGSGGFILLMSYHYVGSISAAYCIRKFLVLIYCRFLDKIFMAFVCLITNGFFCKVVKPNPWFEFW